MLDGLLGRTGFYSKCKSLIKLTRTRIDVARRKRCATQKFLRKDIADLLANGLQINAYGRAEGLVKEMILSSCYDFVDHVCEIILKHLPVLQKLRQCPEECREAVASLMFAAARFSDLPDLRDLRDLFQERYGTSLEYFVNPKLAENITQKPPSMEKKVQLMQEIAVEFSISWDSRDFEETTSNPSPPKQNQKQSPVTVHAAESKVGRHFTEEIVHKTVNDDLLTGKKRGELKRNVFRGAEIIADRHAPHFAEESVHMTVNGEVLTRKRRDELKHKVFRGPEIITDRYTPPFAEVHNTVNHEVLTRERRDELKRDVFRGAEISTDQYTPPSLKEKTTPKREENVIYPQRRENKFTRNSEGRIRPLAAVQIGTSSPGKELKCTDNVPHRDMFSTSSRPKPVQPEDVKTGLKTNFRSVILPPPYVKPSKCKSDLGKHANRDSFVEVNNSDEAPNHHKKKHESKNGAQILFDDDEHFEKDEDVKMIDKFLLQYSKNPSDEEDPGKPKKMTKNPHHITKNETNDSTPTTSRSMSLPPELVSGHHPKKVFTRAASFQLDTPTKHVHPKLPDYEDLAARFTALRASQD